MNSRISRASLRIVLPYVLFGGLWIALSDRALETLATDPALITQWSIYKGWAFVFVTAALLFLLLRAELRARERGEVALRESESHYRQLFDANPHPMWVYDSETLGFLAVNDAAVAHYGFSRDEFMAMRITDIRPPEDVPRLLQDIAAHRDSPVKDSGLWRHCKRDGAQIEVEIRSHALAFAGRPARLVLAHDVTARRQAERALQQSERFARSVLDSLTANIAIVDEEGRIVAVNRAWRRFAEQNAPMSVPVNEGADYLQVCDRAQGEAADEARAFAAGLRKVMRGQCAEFGLVYPCHSPDEQRWFAARVTRLPGDGPAQVVVAHADITALKRTEAAARQLADRLGQYLSASPCIVYALAADGGRFVTEWVSENVQAVLGYSVQEAQVEGWWTEHLHPDDAEAAGEFVAKFRHSDSVVHSYRFRRADGTWIWIQDQLRLQRHAGGEPSRIIGVWTDVTELRQAQQALATSESRFRATFEQAAVGVARLAPDGHWLEVNRRLCEIIGYPRDELLVRRVQDLTHADDRARDAEQKRQILAGDLDSGAIEKRYLRKDGSTVWVHRSIRLVRPADGTPEYFVSVVQDISERKRIEESLRAGEASLARAQRIAHLGSWELLPAIGTLHWSDEVYRIFGLTPDEFGNSFEAFVARVHPEDRDRLQQAQSRALAGEAALDIEHRVVRPDGTVRWVHELGELERDSAGRTWRLNGTVLDITERKQAQAALQASEERYREIVEHSPDLIFIHRDERIHFVNAAGVKMLRAASAAEIVGRAPLEFFRADFHPLIRQRIALMRARPCVVPTIEEKMVALDGAELDVEVSASSFRSGEHLDIQVVCRDVTERKRAEAALRDSEERFRQLAENIKEVFWLTDPAKNRMIYVSPAYETIWGRACTSLDAAPANWLEAVHPDDRDRVQQAVSSKQVNGTYDEVYRIVRPDGSVRWIHDRAYPVRDARGEVYRIAGTAEDVTERKRVEDELRRLSLAVEQSSESIVITDVHGRIEFVNDAFARISGYRREELLGRNPRLLQSGRTPPETYASMWAALANGEPWQGEFFNRRKDGREYVEAATVSPIRQPDGTITHYVAAKEDVTEKRRIAEELDRHRHRLEDLVAQRTAQLAEAQRQAEAANEAKGAFLANMSHEIRTPMNGVLGMLELLTQSRLSEQQAEMVRTARDSGRTLLSLIDDILDFSKIEAGRMQVEQQPLSIADLVEGLCDSLVPVAGRQGVELRVFVAPEIPEPVLSDPLRLRQILFNLLGNAIKFSAGRKEVAGRVTLRVTVAQDAPLRLAFAVIDNGIGMSTETIERLFTPFTQGEASTTRRYGGTGLGLMICKRLAELMRGEFAVTSTLGKGSTFTLRLPVQVAAAQQARAALPDLAGVHCLLIESPELDVDTLRSYLEHAGASVHHAADAAAALQLASRLPRPRVAIRHTGHAHPTPIPALRAVPDLHHVLITRGRRRRPRIESPDVYSLDGSALRRQALLRAVAIAAGRASPETAHEVSPHAPMPGAIAPPSVAVARDRGELILVAEDDEVNRKVIVRQLELLGRTAEVAHDGAEALRKWHKGRHALLLTDLHMPEMDGYELAGAIRREEAGRAPSSVRRLPIIALTANAMRGEADHARAAGMDDFLTKPLQLDLLRRTLERWLPPAGGAERAVAGARNGRSEPMQPALDIEALKSLVGDDAATLREFLGFFRQAAQGASVQLRKASDVGDARQAGALAHKLKSSSRSVGALPLGDLCAELEEVGKAGDRAAVQELIAPFEAELRRVIGQIEVLLAQAGRPGEP